MGDIQGAYSGFIRGECWGYSGAYSGFLKGIVGDTQGHIQDF